jgi:hypothetical protein
MQLNLLIFNAIGISRGIAVMGADRLIMGEGHSGVAPEVPVNGSTTSTIR